MSTKVVEFTFLVPPFHFSFTLSHSNPQAASALIYPFAWHHIYLPLLPMTLKDYLTAPMPFLVGLPAQMLPSLKQMAIDEATIVDLDLGR